MKKTLLELLAEDKNENKNENEDIIRFAVATNQRNQQSLSALKRLAEEEGNDIRYANAKNSHTTSQVLDMLSEDKMFNCEKNVKELVAWNENTPSEVFATLVSDKNITINFYGREITLKNLVELAHSKCVEDRISVARYDAPPRILALLATDEDPRVREAVAWNKFTPAKLLRTLTYDVDPYVRVQVAQNKNVPVESLIELATDNAPFVRKAVAINEKTPAETLSILARDKDEYIRAAVASNPNTSPEILAQLAEDEDNGVRRAVAKNPHTPYNTLVMLTKDKNVSVRIRAEEALQERTVKKEQNIGR